MNLKMSFLQRLDEIVHGHEANGIAVIATLTFESTSSFFTFEVSLLLLYELCSSRCRHRVENVRWFQCFISVHAMEPISFMARLIFLVQLFLELYWVL